jgi:hypothetical protein
MGPNRADSGTALLAGLDAATTSRVDIEVSFLNGNPAFAFRSHTPDNGTNATVEKGNVTDAWTKTIDYRIVARRIGLVLHRGKFDDCDRLSFVVRVLDSFVGGRTRTIPDWHVDWRALRLAGAAQGDSSSAIARVTRPFCPRGCCQETSDQVVVVSK